MTPSTQSTAGQSGAEQSTADRRYPLVLAVCGASAQVLALRSLQLLLEAGEAVDLIISRGAFEVWRAELGLLLPVAPAEQEKLLRERCGTTAGRLRCYRWNDQAAAPASGSYRSNSCGGAVRPCAFPGSGFRRCRPARAVRTGACRKSCG